MDVAQKSTVSDYATQRKVTDAGLPPQCPHQHNSFNNYNFTEFLSKVSFPVAVRSSLQFNFILWFPQNLSSLFFNESTEGAETTQSGKLLYAVISLLQNSAFLNHSKKVFRTICIAYLWGKFMRKFKLSKLKSFYITVSTLNTSIMSLSKGLYLSICRFNSSGPSS
jgi:hypothetical protein